MYILGINCFAHDSAAALVHDGVLIGSAEEERFTRQKHTGVFPAHAIRWCCKEAGIEPARIDHVVYYWNPYKAFLPRALHMLRYFPRSLALAYGRRDKELPMYYLARMLREKIGISRTAKFHYAEHHQCHAASSFFLSPFEKAAILTIDAAGEWDTTWLGSGQADTLAKITSVRFPHSLGVVYSAFTDFLGFRANSGEGKIMGLAPYGDPARYYEQFKNMIIDNANGSFRINLDYFAYHYRGKPHWFSNKTFAIFGNPRAADEPLEERHKDIAAALQRRTEEIGLSLACWLQKKTRLKNLCLSGGVCLNSVMNGKILKETDFDDIYIQPAAHDAGASIGACFWLWNGIMKNKRNSVLTTAYLGPSYNESEYEQEIRVLAQEGAAQTIQCKKVENAPAQAATLIAQGKIIGWFQGRMEIGPRALGNRSILADPRTAAMKDTLNARVKFREGFRPFAPSVLEEKLAEWFDCGYPSPFMLLVYDVLPEKRAQVPAITHVDGTGRVQSVREEDNPRYYALIKEFEKVTGVPLVLNTSFNIRGEPIVNTPREAVTCFLKTGMDALFLGDYLFLKSETSAASAMSAEEQQAAYHSADLLENQPER